MQYFFWYCQNINMCEFDNFNNGTVTVIQKKFVWLHQMREQIKSLFLLTLLQKVYFCFLYHLPAIQRFTSTWTKSYKDVYHFKHTNKYNNKHTNKHTNEDNKICPVASFTCFQQHSHDRLLALRYNSGMKKLEWTHLLLTWTKSLICQIDANCSPFQSLDMLPFHIRPARLKLTYYS